MWWFDAWKNEATWYHNRYLGQVMMLHVYQKHQWKQDWSMETECIIFLFILEKNQWGWGTLWSPPPAMLTATLSPDWRHRQFRWSPRAPPSGGSAIHQCVAAKIDTSNNSHNLQHWLAASKMKETNWGCRHYLIDSSPDPALRKMLNFQLSLVEPNGKSERCPPSSWKPWSRRK